jgi:hypothetical protein
VIQDCLLEGGSFDSRANERYGMGVFRAVCDAGERAAQPAPAHLEWHILGDAYQQFRRWSRSGLWDLQLDALAGRGPAPKTVQMIDSTVIRAHHQAAGAKGGLKTRVLAARAVALRAPAWLRHHAERSARRNGLQCADGPRRDAPDGAARR